MSLLLHFERAHRRVYTKNANKKDKNSYTLIYVECFVIRDWY